MARLDLPTIVEMTPPASPAPPSSDFMRAFAQRGGGDDDESDVSEILPSRAVALAAKTFEGEMRDLDAEYNRECAALLKAKRAEERKIGEVEKRRRNDEMVDAVVTRLKTEILKNESATEIRYVHDASQDAMKELHAQDKRKRDAEELLASMPVPTTPAAKAAAAKASQIVDAARPMVGREHLNYESVPEGMLDNIVAVLNREDPANPGKPKFHLAIRAEIFKSLLVENPWLLITESQARTAGRESVNHFHANTTPDINTSDTMQGWLNKRIGPWAQMEMRTRDYLVQTQGSSRPLSPIPVGLKKLFEGSGCELEAKIFRLDDSFYAFCFFTSIPNRRGLYKYLGCFYCQSDQSHQLDMSIRSRANQRTEEPILDELPPSAAAAEAAASTSDATI